MVRVVSTAGRRQAGRFLGASLLALALSSAAGAQCAPEPTIAGGTTTCSGLDTNGLVVTTDRSTVEVRAAAIVQGGGAPAITVDIPAGTAAFAARQATILVSGQVDGGGQMGISLLSGSVPTNGFDFGGTRLAVTVLARGSVTGADGIIAASSTGNANGPAVVTLDNAGSIRGTAGLALSSVDGGLAGFGTIINRATGVIGAIAGPIGTLTNAGTIDGGSRSAIDATGGSNRYSALGDLTNTGIIRSGSAAATLIVRSASLQTNDGVIANSVGTTIDGSFLRIANNAAGRITGGGGTAIAADSSIDLTNAGRIEGNVVLGSNTNFTTSRIDSSLGIIVGDVSLGAGNDTVIARYVGGAAVTGINGTLSGGAGTDTLRVAFATDTSVATSISLPTDFERLGLAAAPNTTVTLAPGFTATSSILLAGSGTIVNRATIEGAGDFITDEFQNTVRFVNEGTIRATPGGSNTAAVNLANAASFTNNGQISSPISGVIFRSNGSFTNSGSIVSAAPALTLSNGVATNSGTLQSSGGTAVEQVFASLVNSGTIIGASFGVSLSGGSLVNSGSITGQGSTGVAMRSGTLDNRAGGVISGPLLAVGGSSMLGGLITNAGTINGSVTIANSFPSSFLLANNRYFALPGGVLNGDLTLGASDYLVTQIVNPGPGQFAGITGTVTARDSNLRYQVRADVTAVAAPLPGFRTVGYELFGGAKLTVTAPNGTTAPMTLAGTGTVDVTATIAATTTSAITVNGLLVGSGFSGTPSSLAITSRGNLSLTYSDRNTFPYAAVVIGSGDSFVNAGTITVRDLTGTTGQSILAIGSGTIVNSGTINLAAATGVGNALTFTNTGSILQIAGGGAATGVSDVPTIVNSGRIDVGGVGITSSPFSFTPSTITNLAGGTIAGGSGIAIRIAGGSVTNAGAVTGSILFGSQSSRYVAAGGTVAGDVLFGSGSDIFLQEADSNGVSGVIDGGAGTDIFGRSFAANGSVTIAALTARNFENALVLAKGLDTVATLNGPGTLAGTLYAAGDGKVVNEASIDGSLLLQDPTRTSSGQNTPSPVLVSFDNGGAIAGSVSGTVGSFINRGSVGTAGTNARIGIFNAGTLSFTNSGEIVAPPVVNVLGSAPGTQLEGSGAITFANSGRIAGGVGITAGSSGATTTVSATNSGVIAGADRGLAVSGSLQTTAGAMAIVNSGTISATAADPTRQSFLSTYALLLQGNGGASATVVNAAGGAIQATGVNAVAVAATGSALTLDNAGTITTVATAGSARPLAVGSLGSFANVIRNTGTITGSISLGGGDDTVENGGTITGDVALGGGDDRFVQRGAGRVFGQVDGGAGRNAFVVDSTGDGAIAGDQFVNFGTFNQIGSGTVQYAGRFGVDTIALDGGTLAVAAGQTVSTLGSVTVSGGSAGVAVVNSGTIAGSVRFGAGNDTYTEGAGSVAGQVDGGAGSDLYRVVLAGDRTGIAPRSNFERLAVAGTGTLSLTLDQTFDSITLDAAGLNLALAGFGVGRIDGSDAANAVTVDGDVPIVSLGGGDDALSLAGMSFAGRYDGGSGSDVLRLRAVGNGGVTVTGSVTGFETILLPEAGLTVAGTFGSPGTRMSLGDGAQTVTVAAGGTISGTLDLGGGNDELRVAADGTIAGTVEGGSGTDLATFSLTGDRTLAATALSGFERLVADGRGTLTLAGGAFAFDQVSAVDGLAIAADAGLTTRRLVFGGSDNRLLIAGAFRGSIDGGGGTDQIEIAAGTADAPIALADVANVEALRMKDGFATVSGTATFGQAAVDGGRLVGLAGSTITAAAINVAAPATFGSAGTVNGNVLVAGTLSPGASPGTMTVNGNVALASGSTSLVELSPTISDQLLVSGSVSIANGASLTLTGARAPGAAPLDLIVASGGITGSFTTVNQSSSIFGFLRQTADRLQFFSQFSSVGLTPQATSAVNALNDLLSLRASSAAFQAVLPGLLTAGGNANGQAFARLTPEAYASATQITIENGLTLAKAARSSAAADKRDEPGAFTFAQGLGGWRSFNGNDAYGTSRFEQNSYGMLGGIGFGTGTVSVSGFIGYLKTFQKSPLLNARTDADGVVAGAIGHAAFGGFSVSTMLAYDGSRADTRRTLSTGRATSRYDLHGWTGDASVGYAVSLDANWGLKPEAGLTYVSSRRQGASETGSPFALNVARRKASATFGDAAITLTGGLTETARVHPWASLGVRHQIDGQGTFALAGFQGSAASFGAIGVRRQATLATLGGGFSAELTRTIGLFAAYRGEFGGRGTGAAFNTGLRLRF